MTDILYFGRLSDVTGKPSENIELPSDVSHARDLRTWAEARFEAEGVFLEPTVRIAVNGEIVEPGKIASISTFPYPKSAEISKSVGR